MSDCICELVACGERDYCPACARYVAILSVDGRPRRHREIVAPTLDGAAAVLWEVPGMTDRRRREIVFRAESEGTVDLGDGLSFSIEYVGGVPDRPRMSRSQYEQLPRDYRAVGDDGTPFALYWHEKYGTVWGPVDIVDAWVLRGFQGGEWMTLAISVDGPEEIERQRDAYAEHHGFPLEIVREAAS